MDSERILRGMIEIYQNDFLGGYDGEDRGKLRIIFLELIVAVTRYVNNFRYCNKVECSCSPESKIQTIVEKHKEDIFNKLFIGEYGLSDVPLSEIRNFLKEF